MQKHDDEDDLVTPKQSTSKMQKELFPSDGITIKTEEIDENDEKKTSINTPTAKKSLLNGPRTPTPFKNALNEFRKIRGQTYVPSSPNGLVEDITEIMNKERQQDSTMDSVYETDSSVAQNVQPEAETNASIVNITNPKRLTYEEADTSQQQSMKKAKKSLESTWNTNTTTTTDDYDDFPNLVETPVSKLFSIENERK